MKTVLILGAGFAGLELATRLSEEVPHEVDVLVVDSSDACMKGGAESHTPSRSGRGTSAVPNDPRGRRRSRDPKLAPEIKHKVLSGNVRLSGMDLALLRAKVARDDMGWTMRFSQLTEWSETHEKGT